MMEPCLFVEEVGVSVVMSRAFAIFWDNFVISPRKSLIVQQGGYGGLKPSHYISLTNYWLRGGRANSWLGRVKSFDWVHPGRPQ